MQNLRQQLEAILRTNAAVAGVGNPACGDDGAGVRVAQALLAAGCANVFVAETTPEDLLPKLARLGFNSLLLVDAVEFGGETGAVTLLESAAIQSRFPQVSTHKISLGTLARMIELDRGVRVWLLGIQPEGLKAATLSPVVQKTVDALVEMLADILKPGPSYPIPAGANEKIKSQIL